MTALQFTAELSFFVLFFNILAKALELFCGNGILNTVGFFYKNTRSEYVMTKTEFSELVKKHNINENLVVSYDSTKDGYCIRQNYSRWEVFYRERGKE